MIYYLFSILAIYYLQGTGLVSSCYSFYRCRGLLDWCKLVVYKSCRSWIGRYTVQTSNNPWMESETQGQQYDRL